MECTECGTPVDPERWAIGKDTCPPCGSAQANHQIRSNYNLVLMPKQGFGIVTANSPDLLNGRSSGR